MGGTKMRDKTVLWIFVSTLILSLGACCCPSEADLEASRERKKERQAKAKKKAEEKEKKVVAEEALSEYRTAITIKVEVDDKKTRKKHWDSGKGKPDPLIKVWNRETGRVIKSSVYKDRLNVQFLVDDFAVSENDKINIRIEDKDISVNDHVGVFDLRFQPGRRESGSIAHGWLSVRFEDATSNQ